MRDEQAGIPIVPEWIVSRAATCENPTAESGAGGAARGGRKGAPCIPLLPAGQTATLLDFRGAGVVRHIWMTWLERDPLTLRNLILRAYWDDCPKPSIETPIGEFFGVAHGRAVDFASALTTMTLGRGFNCYYAMPFLRSARITIQNDLPDGRDLKFVFYQVDFEEWPAERMPADTGRLHGAFRRENPTRELHDYCLLDTTEGPGRLLGCVVGVRPLAPEWWGEGEVKCYIDGDCGLPTICGTGSEDYFCGAWGMERFVTPLHGCPLHEVSPTQPHGLFSLYRFHAADPIYYRQSLRMTVQQIGHREPDGLFERSDDWSSLALWYQRQPNRVRPALPDAGARTAGIGMDPPPA